MLLYGKKNHFEQRKKFQAFVFVQQPNCSLPQARQEMEDARHKQGEWRAVKEEVIELIQKAKTEATGIIEAIRSGSKVDERLSHN